MGIMFFLMLSGRFVIHIARGLAKCIERCSNDQCLKWQLGRAFGGGIPRAVSGSFGY